MPRTRCRCSGASGQQRADGAVDVEPEPFACAEVASASRSSVAPVLMVAALPMTQKGCRPAALSSATMAASASTSISKRALTGTLRNERAPSPSDSIAFCTQLCTSTDA